ncbi:ATP-dependent Clp protease adaptor ClpS [Rariglobus hedericola]|uniref:Clp protease ClpS n=1 Tax=Rariglobus hedericola TaxID=2597822 RepID=A0A556QP25_9BACT|nr:ATP-dependent Clp protease adaptor ClpS [Rariglobus hedericola]TSJ78393.1 Clp protease ClpS [Rariglobus hedericola]
MASSTRTPFHSPSGIEPIASRGWRVVFLNDAVTRMSYAVMVLRKLFGFDEATATKHMLEAHESGRSVVWQGVRENAEAYVFSLQQWHLSATFERDEES